MAFTFATVSVPSVPLSVKVSNVLIGLGDSRICYAGSGWYFVSRSFDVILSWGLSNNH